MKASRHFLSYRKMEKKYLNVIFCQIKIGSNLFQFVKHNVKVEYKNSKRHKENSLLRQLLAF